MLLSDAEGIEARIVAIWIYISKTGFCLSAASNDIKQMESRAMMKGERMKINIVEIM